MTKTTNYDLNQWDPEDPVIRTDFNEDNAKLDAALASLRDQTLRCTAGTYVGNGKHGSLNPTVLDFADTLGRTPLLVVIRPKEGYATGMILVNGMTNSMYTLSTSYAGSACSTLSWEGTSVSLTGTDPSYQMNSLNTTYCYFAIG